MSKRNNRKSRDTPVSTRNSAVAVTNFDLWKSILCDGYIPLYDCPEVRMCVNAYADLISSMTIHLMQNTEIGDKRVVNELSRKIDINPCANMNRKAWVWNIVNVMLTSGDGNCVVYPQYSRNGFLDNLIPLTPMRISFVDTDDGNYIINYGGKILKPGIHNYIERLDNC